MNDVLVDTSVWIDFFRSKTSPHSVCLKQLLHEERVCATNLVRAEIIPGARSKQEFLMLWDYFQGLPEAPEPPTLWSEVIQNQFKLKQKAGHVMSIPDMLLATVCMTNNKKLFTRDLDFERIAKILPLTLFRL